jgi:hypothetical protein
LTTDDKAKKARVDAKRRSVAGAERLAANAVQKLTRRKSQLLLTTDEKVEKARLDAERRNVAGA